MIPILIVRSRREPHMLKTSFDHWPIVVFTFVGDLTLADAEAVATESDRALDRKQRHACIFDGSLVTARPSALVRKRLADYTQESGPRSKQWAVGTAIIVPNALIRGVMTAIHWVAPPTIPVETVADFPAAIRWCSARLEAAGVTPPRFGASGVGSSGA